MSDPNFVDCFTPCFEDAELLPVGTSSYPFCGSALDGAEYQAAEGDFFEETPLCHRETPDDVETVVESDSVLV